MLKLAAALDASPADLMTAEAVGESVDSFVEPAEAPPAALPDVRPDVRAPQARRRWTVTSLGVLVALGLIGLLAVRARRVGGQANEQQLVTLWKGPDIAWIGDVSPDGNRIVFVQPRESNLAVHDLRNGAVKLLTDKDSKDRDGGVMEGARFSGNGEWVAYARDFGLSRRVELYVVRTGGRDRRLIRGYTEASIVSVKDWSLDGRFLLVEVLQAGGAELHSIELKTGEVEHRWPVPAHGISSAVYMPDASGVAWGSESRVGPEFLYRQGPQMEFPAGLKRLRNLPVGWSADRRTLLYVGDQAGSLDLWSLSLAAGAVPALLHRNIGAIRPLRVAADGSFYFGVSTSMLRVQRVQIDPVSGLGSGPIETVSSQLDCRNQRATWSSDGRLAWPCSTTVSDKLTAPDRIRVMNTKGEIHELRPNVPMVDWIRWAPEGRSLLVGGHSLAWVDAISGTVLQTLRNGSAAEGVPDGVLTPDGSKLIFKLRLRLAEPSRLMIRDLSNGVEEELLPSVYRFDLAADGRRLAYCTFDDRNEYIRILTLATKTVQEVHSEPRDGRINSISGAPDRNHIYYAQRGSAHRVNVQSRRVEHLLLEMEALRDLQIHPSGRWASFTSGDSQHSEVRRLKFSLDR